MTGNPAAPRTVGGRNRPASYGRGIDPAPYGIPRPASAAEGRPPSPLGTPFGRKPDVSGPSRNPRPGTGGPGHASNGTARKRAAVQRFSFGPFG